MQRLPRNLSERWVSNSIDHFPWDFSFLNFQLGAAILKLYGCSLDAVILKRHTIVGSIFSNILKKNPEFLSGRQNSILDGISDQVGACVGHHLQITTVFKWLQPYANIFLSFSICKQGHFHAATCKWLSPYSKGWVFTKLFTNSFENHKNTFTNNHSSQMVGKCVAPFTNGCHANNHTQMIVTYPM